MTEQQITHTPPKPGGRREGACVTVEVVDDQTIWRDCLQSMLEDTEFSIVAEAATLEEAVRAGHAAHPDLLLLDIHLARGNNLDTLRAIHHELPQTCIIILTPYETPTYMALAMQAGASSYVLKGVERDDLVHTLRQVVTAEQHQRAS